MTDFLKIAKSIAVHFAHICAYGVETVNIIENNVLHITYILILFGNLLWQALMADINIGNLCKYINVCDL